uniref:Uncharacterized protein n=1 Tax=Clastoptera arizonana TaxID=38151 RepID=A0A1B6C3P0_9HEMI
MGIKMDLKVLSVVFTLTVAYALEVDHVWVFKINKMLIDTNTMIGDYKRELSEMMPPVIDMKIKKYGKIIKKERVLFEEVKKISEAKKFDIKDLYPELNSTLQYIYDFQKVEKWDTSYFERTVRTLLKIELLNMKLRRLKLFAFDPEVIVDHNMELLEKEGGL